MKHSIMAAITLLLMGASAAQAQADDFRTGKRYLSLQLPSTPDQRDRNWLPDPDRVVHYVRPAEADPNVQHYLRDNIALFRRDLVTDRSPLVVYLPGTFGAPDRAKMLLGTIAGQGYRVLGLMYDNVPSTGPTCHRNPDPTCASRFRARRAFAEPVTTDNDDPPNETVVARLAATLRYLDARYPGERWGSYLDATGQPIWQRIVVAGHSQGAGIAAFIAKRFAVARVVLLSSPWDHYHAIVDGQDRSVLSPWLRQQSATPPDRWYGLFHASEPNARRILLAFQALRVPPSHIRVLKLPARSAAKDNSAFHGSVSSDYTTPLDAKGIPAYRDDWRFVFGEAAGLRAGPD